MKFWMINWFLRLFWLLWLRYLVQLCWWNEWHWTLRIMSQHWFREWLGVMRQQVINWANVDLDLCRHMESLVPNELTMQNIKSFQGIFSFGWKTSIQNTPAFHNLCEKMNFCWQNFGNFVHKGQCVKPPVLLTPWTLWEKKAVTPPLG